MDLPGRLVYVDQLYGALCPMGYGVRRDIQAIRLDDGHHSAFAVYYGQSVLPDGLEFKRVTGSTFHRLSLYEHRLYDRERSCIRGADGKHQFGGRQCADREGAVTPTKI